MSSAEFCVIAQRLGRGFCGIAVTDHKGRELRFPSEREAEDSIRGWKSEVVTYRVERCAERAIDEARPVS